ncbi:MAG: hypothetical protein Q8O93_01995 [bacterium]|nr:hypothetical protein [bacterium]
MKAKKFLIIIVAGLLLSAVVGLYDISSGYAGTSEIFKQVQTSGEKNWGVWPSSTGLPFIIQTVISAFLGLLGIIFLILIIYAGYNWMTAQGDEDKVTKAKDTLARAIIGLIIIIAAYSITYFVFNALPGGGGAGDFNSITTY